MSPYSIRWFCLNNVLFTLFLINKKHFFYLTEHRPEKRAAAGQDGSGLRGDEEEQGGDASAA